VVEDKFGVGPDLDEVIGVEGHGFARPAHQVEVPGGSASRVRPEVSVMLNPDQILVHGPEKRLALVGFGVEAAQPSLRGLVVCRGLWVLRGLGRAVLARLCERLRVASNQLVDSLHHIHAIETNRPAA
jgi:hypothetical protein